MAQRQLWCLRINNIHVPIMSTSFFSGYSHSIEVVFWGCLFCFSATNLFVSQYFVSPYSLQCLNLVFYFSIIRCILYSIYHLYLLSSFRLDLVWVNSINTILISSYYMIPHIITILNCGEGPRLHQDQPINNQRIGGLG